MPSDKNEHQLLHELMLENQRLLTENNELLKKIRKASLWSFWIRIVWILVILGVPLVVYFYVVEPYFTSLGSSFQVFQAGLQEVPGWKQFYEAVGGAISTGE
ncbi:MAG: hypothetical protein LR008_02955 [Candidatus Pacebacteria bacterium]|nr:hypothetical protein [Candidatus Paceibacterota bacterium]